LRTRLIELMKEKADLEEQMVSDHRELERIQSFSKDL
jgi:hypothetical protein